MVTAVVLIAIDLHGHFKAKIKIKKYILTSIFFFFIKKKLKSLWKNVHSDSLTYNNTACVAARSFSMPADSLTVEAAAVTVTKMFGMAKYRMNFCVLHKGLQAVRCACKHLSHLPCTVAINTEGRHK